MNDQELKSEYDQNGFIVVKNFLNNQELNDLTSHLDHYIREVVPGLDKEAAFYEDPNDPSTLKQLNRMSSDPFFEKYSSHSKWKNLAESLIGEEAHCEFPEWFNKPPNTNHPTPAHQDNYYFNLAPPNVLTMWLALDNVDDENGCLRYVPGSHLKGKRPHSVGKVLGFSQGINDFSEEDEASEVKTHMKPGDLAVHHGWTIHRAMPNQSKTRSRRAFAMVYKGKSCLRDEKLYQEYLQQCQDQHAELADM